MHIRQSAPVLQLKLKSLQVFRGFAAMLVLLFHATTMSKVFLNYDFVNGIFLFGYSGVDFFFVLSGFIIFWAHGAEIGKRGAVRPYARKRFIRIYPVYWIVALALIPVYFGLPHQPNDWLVLLKSLLLLPQANNPILLVAWSLSSEVFFYALFGFAIYFSWRRTWPVFTVWLVITAVFYVLKLLNNGTSFSPAHTGFVFSAYNLEFAMGCFAAYLVRRLSFDGRWLVIAGGACFLILGLSEKYLAAHFGRHHSIVAYGLASMVIVCGAVLWEQRRAKRPPALLLLFGDASYSIYLTHCVVLEACLRSSSTLGILARVSPTLVTGMSIVIALAVGVLFYRYVERPLISRLRRRSGSSSPFAYRPIPSAADVLTEEQSV